MPLPCEKMTNGRAASAMANQWGFSHPGHAGLSPSDHGFLSRKFARRARITLK